MYEVENSHPPIVDRDTFDKVQSEMTRRADLSASGDKAAGKYSNSNIFSTMIKCACGDTFRRYWHVIKGEKIPVWVCKTHQADKEKCSIKPIREYELQDAFVRALNNLVGDKDAVIAQIMQAAESTVTGADQAEYDNNQQYLTEARDHMFELNKLHAKHLINQEQYRVKIGEVMQRIDRLVEETQFMHNLIVQKKLAADRLNEIRQTLSHSLQQGFNETLFKKLTAEIQVVSDNEVEFILSCGLRVKERL
jgi:hypothetical protein